ncbi:MAG: transposase, partial [Clostridia bacterium]|nr:transposase [Clostridia bacterium]
ENEEIKEAVDIFEDITSDEELRRIMELRDKAIRDEKNMIRTAEKKAKIEIVRKLLEMNMDIEDIINATGLSKEEIEKIKLD